MGIRYITGLLITNFGYKVYHVPFKIGDNREHCRPVFWALFFFGNIWIPLSFPSSPPPSPPATLIMTNLYDQLFKMADFHLQTERSDNEWKAALVINNVKSSLASRFSGVVCLGFYTSKQIFNIDDDNIPYCLVVANTFVTPRLLNYQTKELFCSLGVYEFVFIKLETMFLTSF